MEQALRDRFVCGVRSEAIQKKLVHAYHFLSPECTTRVKVPNAARNFTTAAYGGFMADGHFVRSTHKSCLVLE